MYYKRFPSITIILALNLTLLDHQILGFTVKENKNKNQGVKRLKFRLPDNIHLPIKKPLTEENKTMKPVICKLGTRSSTNCMRAMSATRYNLNRKPIKIANYSIENPSDHANDLTIYSLPGHKNEDTKPNNKNKENCTESSNEPHCKVDNTTDFKPLPLLDALKDMLLALDKLLELAILSNVTDGNVTNKNANISSLKPFELTMKVLAPNVTKTPGTKANIEHYISNKSHTTSATTENTPHFTTKMKSTSVSIKNTSNMIDDVIAAALKKKVVDPIDNLQSLEDNVKNKDLNAAIHETASTRLYKWCLSIIKAEKKRDKKSFDSLVKMSRIKYRFKPEFHNKETLEDENVTKYINGVLDCIGFVNIMEGLHHSNK